MSKMRKPGVILGEALKNLGSKPATIDYPKTKDQVPTEGYRGRLTYDNSKCPGCNLCAKDCPAFALKVVNIGEEGQKKFTLDWYIDRCIFCGQCVESCRRGCIQITGDFELAVLDKDKLHVDLLTYDK